MTITFRRSMIAAAAVAAAMASAAANAALTLVAPEDFGGSGLGAVNTSLTLQGKGASTFESGAVGVDATNSLLISGNAKTGSSQTQLLTLGALGIASAADLRVVFNATEPGATALAGITLENLVLTVYDTSGATLFTSGAFTPVTFADTATGVGNSGFVFAFDAADLALAQSTVFTGDFGSYRLGLTASASGAQGGPDTFFIASTAVTVPIPEPETYALLLAGLGVIGFVSRRRKA